MMARIPTKFSGLANEKRCLMRVDSGLRQPVPLHPQKAHVGPGHKRAEFLASEWATDHSIILPLYHQMTEEEQDRVVAALRAALNP